MKKFFLVLLSTLHRFLSKRNEQIGKNPIIVAARDFAKKSAKKIAEIPQVKKIIEKPRVQKVLIVTDKNKGALGLITAISVFLFPIALAFLYHKHHKKKRTSKGSD